MTVYYCKHCKNLVVAVHDSGVKMKCCGEDMEELIPNTADGSKEKHVPVGIKEDGKITIKVGSEPHPMTEEHYIEWVALETPHGFFVKYLKPGEKPEKSFCVSKTCSTCNMAKKKIYAYCNLHGLYSAEI